MRKFNTKLRILDREQGKKIKAGVCENVAYLLLNIVAKQTKLTDNEGYKFSPDCYSPWYVCFTPKNWCEIEHYCVSIECVDGKVLLDVPMKEYTYRDIPQEPEEIGYSAFWYFSGNKNPQGHLIESARDIMESWQCSWEEAKELAVQVRDENPCYKVNITKDSLFDLLNQSQGD
jgi:hypothetical protein